MRFECVPHIRGVSWSSRWARAARGGWVVGVLAAAACSGPGRTQIAIGLPPAKDTHAVLAGGLCQDNHCSCRGDQGDGGVGVPETKDRKRFEIRMTSAYDLWTTIDGATVLYKNPERAEVCFYIDLPAGLHQVELRASNPDGVSAGLQIHELGTRTKSWYDTFAFACGVPGVCSFEDLDNQKAQYAATQRGLYDRCGTTRITGLSWDHGKSPDQLHPSELLLRLTLDIYRFAAWKQHGDDTCGERGGRRGAPDEPTPPPDEPQ